MFHNVIGVTSVVGSARKVGIHERRAEMLERPEGRTVEVRRSPAITRAALLLIVMLLSGVGVADVTSRRDGGKGARFPVSVLSGSDQATVSWQIRAGSRVRIRLYRTAPGGQDELIGEFKAEPGVTVFETTDDARPPGPFVYQIRIVDFGDRERTLGTLLCVDPGLSDPTATVSWDASHLVGDPCETVELYRPVTRSVEGRQGSAFHPASRCPDPPVPRPSAFPS